MYRILMIDDDPYVVALAKLILERKGDFKVLGAYCGQEGLDILNRESNIDLILLDIMMVGMNGWEVLEALKSNQQHARIPVLMVTAHHYLAKDKTQRPDSCAEVDDFVLKPFVASDFLNKVYDAIRYKRVMI